MGETFAPDMTQAAADRNGRGRRRPQATAFILIPLLLGACSSLSSMGDAVSWVGEAVWPFGEEEAPMADMAEASMRTYAAMVAEVQPSAAAAVQLATRSATPAAGEEHSEEQEDAREKSREERLEEEVRARAEARAKAAAEREAAEQVGPLPDASEADIAVRVLFQPGDTTLPIRAEDDLTALAEELRGSDVSKVRITAYWSSESGDSGIARLAALKHGLRVRSFLNQRGVGAANVVLQRIQAEDEAAQVVDVRVGGTQRG